MVKAQIPAGGRAEGTFKGQDLKSGIRTVKTLVNVGADARSMLGRNLITAQTGPEGMPVERVYVELAVKVDREVSLSLLMDEFNQSFVLLVSPEGGTGIEDSLKHSPDAVAAVPVSLAQGPDAAVLDAALERYGFPGDEAESMRDLAGRMVALARERDLTLLEINPVGITGGECIAPGCQDHRGRQCPLPPGDPVADGNGGADQRQPSQGQQRWIQLHTHGRRHRVHDGGRGVVHGDPGRPGAFRRPAGQFPRSATGLQGQPG